MGYTGQQPYQRYPGYAPPVEPLRNRQLPLPMETTLATSSGRLIQPRPPGGGPIFSTNIVEEPARKKRGRPTNAEMARKAEEAAARGEVYPPPKRPRAEKGEKASPRPSLGAEGNQATAGSPVTAAGPSSERPAAPSTTPATQSSQRAPEPPSTHTPHPVRQDSDVPKDEAMVIEERHERLPRIADMPMGSPGARSDAPALPEGQLPSIAPSTSESSSREVTQTTADIPTTTTAAAVIPGQKA
jgi:hypothetical protein